MVAANTLFTLFPNAISADPPDVSPIRVRPRTPD